MRVRKHSHVMVEGVTELLSHEQALERGIRPHVNVGGDVVGVLLEI